MSSRSNPNYLQFGKTETVVTFKTDRGQLRRNDMGDFFFRETADGHFTCSSPDLERRTRWRSLWNHARALRQGCYLEGLANR